MKRIKFYLESRLLYSNSILFAVLVSKWCEYTSTIKILLYLFLMIFKKANGLFKLITANRRFFVTKVLFTCSECSTEYNKWSGNCKNCGKWNCLEEKTVTSNIKSNLKGSTFSNSKPISIKNISSLNSKRLQTKYKDFNRVLGGGFIYGSVTIISGEPGIGKSTLLLQIASSICDSLPESK